MVGGLTAAGALILSVSIALALPGDALQPPIMPPAGCSGIGVAYDGKDILYTCASEAAVRKTDLAGADNGVVATADAGGNPVSVDAIAWDPNENRLWGGDLDGAGACRIWSIDMATGLATLRFSFVDPHGGCDFFFFDGITVDSVTDTLWLSPDVHTFIHHYDKLGNEIVADLIDFAAVTPAGEPDVNSGLAIGLDGNLFAGTNGFSKIVQINPGPPAAFVGVFANVSGRDEDLECGPAIEGKESILSRSLEDGHIDVLEAPKETCKSPVPGDTTPPELKCIETVNPHGNKVPPAGSTTLPGPKGGQNEDGFYQLLAKDNVDPAVKIWVTDVNGSGPFGPFAAGDRVKITEAPGAIPSSKPMGSVNGQAGAIVAHITLTGDAIVIATDAAGNSSKTACLVPPPPK